MKVGVKMGNIDPRSMQFIADRSSWNSSVKTIKGRKLRLIATQQSLRNSRKSRTVYVFSIEGTGIIVYNRSRNGICFMKIAVKVSDMQRFYSTFVVPPTTEKEQQFLDLNNYKLVL